MEVNFSDILKEHSNDSPRFHQNIIGEANKGVILAAQYRAEAKRIEKQRLVDAGLVPANESKLGSTVEEAFATLNNGMCAYYPCRRRVPYGVAAFVKYGQNEYNRYKCPSCGRCECSNGKDGVAVQMWLNPTVGLVQITVKCFGGCDRLEVLKALNLSPVDLFWMDTYVNVRTNCACGRSICYGNVCPGGSEPKSNGPNP